MAKTPAKSPAKSPAPGTAPQQPPQPLFPEPGPFEVMWSQNNIKHYIAQKVTLSYGQAFDGKMLPQYGPKTTKAIDLLFAKATTLIPAGAAAAPMDQWVNYPFLVENLAKLCGPETMPLPTLVGVIYAVYEQAARDEAAAKAAAAPAN